MTVSLLFDSRGLVIAFALLNVDELIVKRFCFGVFISVSLI